MNARTSGSETARGNPADHLVEGKRIKLVRQGSRDRALPQGVFGVEEAARHWFGVPASDLTEVQAARLAAILPSPRTRDPANPTDDLRARARSILDGAATIEADGRAACFEAAGP